MTTVTQTSLPERINAINCLSYDVQPIVEDLKKEGNPEPTIDDVMEVVVEWARDDMGWGTEIVFQDQDGNEL